MKIRLIIGKFSTYGGAEVVAYRFAKFLYERGLLLEVVCGRKEVDDFPGKVLELGFLKPGRFLKTFSFQKKVMQYLKEKAHDSSIVNFSFSKVLGCHVYRNGGGTHKGFLETSIRAYKGLEKIKKRISRASNPINYYNPFLEEQIFLSTKKIIAVSTKVKDEILRYYGHQLEKKIKVIPNGINKKKFNHEKKNESRTQERMRLNFKENDFVIGFASSNFKLKGLEYLIKALQYLDSQKKLLIAGGRNPEYYLSLARKLKIDSRIKFLGKVSKMENFYSAIDCLAHPSFYDTFGNVIAEALSMHVPVLVSKHTGAKDLVIDGKNGFLIDKINEKRIAQLIEKVSELTPDFSVNQILSDEEVFSHYLAVAEQSLNQG